MDIDFSDEDMMPFSWEKCPVCGWAHNPDKTCSPYSPDEEEEDDSEH